MPAAIYSRLAIVALRLIKKYGRPVTLQFATDVPPADATRPWNPAPPALVSFDTIGVVTPSEEQYVDGMTVLSTDEQVIVAALGMPAIPDPKTVVLDGATQYKTVKVSGVDPGPVQLVYIIFLRR